MTQDRTGKCLCGAVAFTARNVPSEFGACHCEMCRRWSGGRWMGVHVLRENLDITGEDHITVFKSSPWAERAFCTTCGASLWYHLTEGPDANGLSIGIGLLDDTNGMKLAQEYYVDRLTGAFDFPEDRVRMTEAEVIEAFAPKDDGAS